MQRAVAPFPAVVEPPEELEPPLPEDPPDDVPPDPPEDVPPEPLTAAAFAVTVTFTLTVFVAVTVGAGSGLAVSVAVAVVVTVGAGWALVAAVFVVVSSWPLPCGADADDEGQADGGQHVPLAAPLRSERLWGGCGRGPMSGRWRLVVRHGPPKAFRGGVTVTGDVKDM